MITMIKTTPRMRLYQAMIAEAMRVSGLQVNILGLDRYLIHIRDASGKLLDSQTVDTADQAFKLIVDWIGDYMDDQPCES